MQVCNIHSHWAVAHQYACAGTYDWETTWLFTSFKRAMGFYNSFYEKHPWAKGSVHTLTFGVANHKGELNSWWCGDEAVAPQWLHSQVWTNGEACSCKECRLDEYYSSLEEEVHEDPNEDPDAHIEDLLPIGW